jgi:hypothetical protein
MTAITTAMVRAVQPWVTSLPNPTLCVSFQPQIQSEKEIAPIHFDILTDTTIYQLYFDTNAEPSADEKIILLLKTYLYTREFPGVTSIGFFNMATGTIYTYEITGAMFEQVHHIWEHTLGKYGA